MLDLSFFNLHRDHRIAGDRFTHSLVQPLRDCIVEAFGGHAHRALNPLSVAADGLAAFNRHSGDLTVSLFIRQPAAYLYNMRENPNRFDMLAGCSERPNPRPGSNTVASIGDHYEFALMTFRETKKLFAVGAWNQIERQSRRPSPHPGNKDPVL